MLKTSTNKWHANILRSCLTPSEQLGVYIQLEIQNFKSLDFLHSYIADEGFNLPIDVSNFIFAEILKLNLSCLYKWHNRIAIFYKEPKIPTICKILLQGRRRLILSPVNSIPESIALRKSNNALPFE